MRKEAQFIQRMPWFYFLIKWQFPHIDRRWVIITFADKVYCRNELREDIMRHEEVHCKQQGWSKWGALKWWIRYVKEPEFRLEQEVEAYQVQYQYIYRHYGRDKAWMAVQDLAKDLSGPMYNNLIGFREAVSKIIQG